MLGRSPATMMSAACTVSILYTTEHSEPVPAIFPESPILEAPFWGSLNSVSVNTVLTKLGGKINESNSEIPCDFCVSRMPRDSYIMNPTN